METEVREGQRLEAADPAHPHHVRPARVVQVRAGRVLVAFDGAGQSPGYWADLGSPRLRPVTWAEENGVPILAPSGESGTVPAADRRCSVLIFICGHSVLTFICDTAPC